MQKDHKSEKRENTGKSYSNRINLVKTQILGVGVTDDAKENILEFVIDSLQKNMKPYYIVTPNPEIIVAANKSIQYKDVLNNAKLALNDGIGLNIAAHVLGKHLRGRFTGVDFMESVCKKVHDWPITVGFLGAGPGIAELTRDCLRKKYPGLNVAFAQEEWNDNTKPIDILFVALGFPKQEFWMADKIGKVNVKVMAGVGGAFDYISGKVPRAPKIFQFLGFEWFFRLIVQPWRWKRQVALLEFCFLVCKNTLLDRK